MWEIYITLALPAVLYFVGNSVKLPLHRVIALLGTWSFEIYLAQVVTTKYFILWYKGGCRRTNDFCSRDNDIDGPIFFFHNKVY